MVHKNQLFVGGERTLEGFSNIGGADFPFQRSGLFFDEGVKAPFSVQNIGNALVFIGAGERDGAAVYALSGNSTQRISTAPVDNVLQSLSETQLKQVRAWSYAQGGHDFVGFVLPDTTFVFDFSTGRWHERQSRVVDSNGVVSIRPVRPSEMVAAYGAIYCGDNEDGRVGRLDSGVFTDYGSVIMRTNTTQPFQNNMQPFSVPYIEATVESGVGGYRATDTAIGVQGWR